MKIAIISFALVVAIFVNGKAQNNRHDQTTDSLIITALSLVNADSLSSSVLALQNYTSRFMMAPNRKEIATWIMNRFISFGIPEVRLDSFLCYTHVDAPPFCTYDTTTWQYNVEAKITGSVYPDREVLMMAHYDSFVSNADPMLAAPGADDNGSSVSALLECARVIMLMDYQPEQTMIFLATAAEELNTVGGSGSAHYATEAAANGRDLAMVVNNDMIGWNDGSWTISLVNDENSQRITDLAMHVIDTYTSLDLNFAWFGTYCDLKYFLYQGYEGIFFMENTMNEWPPYYHTVNDLIDYMDAAYHAEMTRANLGCFLFGDMLANDAALLNIENVPEYNCTGSLSPVITLANYSPDTLYSLDITCRVNEEDSIIVPWTGELAFRETQQVQLPGIGFQPLTENILEISLDNTNGTLDQIPVNNALNVGFGTAPVTPSEVKLKLKLDNNPEQTTWDIKDLEGNVIFSGGPYATPNSLVQVTMNFDESGCYIATVYDEAGNGLQQGFFILYYGSNNIIASIFEFESSEQAQFDVGGTMLADEINPDRLINFYPNPVHNEGYMAIYLAKPTSIDAGIFNLLGIKVIGIPPQNYESGMHTLRFDTGNLEQGLYIISVRAGERVIAGKIIKR